ncbi:hypothetical protein [Aeromicrobium wangtongii]|uniref:Uncharacterized protein n=1 Tax=Aeromicrobium wangtongii TaxID=2969247 RepID=A0ABY5M2H6_9ACTN|nr:hypothetical protein [Aeromicrobium wangtongii]MCD9198382.1 hypothetical protein [Aeromicrobium wangtongii]UUP12413.1 hypothetical protein NQV15_11160 [Aeromicrobium wangtongii]
MSAKSKMSPWVKGPQHNWKTTDKSRQDAGGDIIEEVYTERWIYIFAIAVVALCVVGWWWQASLDGWSRGIVLAATVVVTAYMVVMSAAMVVFWLVGRFLRSI